MSKTAREVIAEHFPNDVFPWPEDNAARVIVDLEESGFVIVPKEPTPEMLKAYFALCSFGGDLQGDNTAADAYRAMIAKAQEL